VVKRSDEITEGQTRDLTKLSVLLYMLRKTDPLFGALPTTCKRLSCDFSAMRGVRAQTVHIRYAPTPSRGAKPGDSWAATKDLARDARPRGSIRSGWMDSKRRAGESRSVWKQARAGARPKSFGSLKRTRLSIVQAAETRLASHFRRAASDFILLCLTLVAIFDNRHGLLKKFDAGERQKPCQP